VDKNQMIIVHFRTSYEIVLKPTGHTICTSYGFHLRSRIISRNWKWRLQEIIYRISPSSLSHQ